MGDLLMGRDLREVAEGVLECRYCEPPECLLVPTP